MNRFSSPRQIAVAACVCTIAVIENRASATDNSSALYIDDNVTLDSPSDSSALFGWSLAAHEGKVLVGGSDDYSYLYDIAGGNELVRLRGDDTRHNDLFGRAVALSDDYALVGANQAQAAYVFDAHTGRQIRKYTDPNAPPSNGFGFGTTVALSGDFAVIGDRGDNTKGTDAGAAYIFRISTGQLTRTLLPLGHFAILDRFGADVDAQGDTLVISAPGANFNSGAAYVYSMSTGSLLRTLAPVETVSGFGNEVVIADGMAIISASTGNSPGAAFLYDLDSGAMLRKFTSPNPANDVSFGDSIAFDGRRVLIGSWGEYQEGNYTVGSAYLFDVETGNLLASWLPSELGLFSDHFGYGVAMDGDYLLASAHRNNGAVYVTVLPEPGSLLLAVWATALAAGARAIVFNGRDG